MTAAARPGPTGPPWSLPSRRLVATHAVGLAVLVLVAVAVTAAYVSAEHTFYTWDYHEYSQPLETIYAQLRLSPLIALVDVYLSTSQDYNLLPTVPMLPLRFVLGGSRIGYEIDAALVFVVPFLLATGWVASRVVEGSRTAVFWSTVAVAMLIPATWVSVLRGFADLGGAAIVAVAIAVYVGDPRLTRLWRPIAIGALLGAAFVFRRPFAYDVVAFGAALTLIIAARALVTARDGAAAVATVLRADVPRLLLLGVAGAATTLAVGHRLVGKLLIVDYGAAYEGYVRDPLSVAGWFTSFYGALTVLAAAAGLLLAWRTSRRVGSDRGEGILFLGSFWVILAAIWALLVGQLGEHYAAHFVVPIAVGLSAFAWTLWQIAPRRRGAVLVGGLVALLLVNAMAGLTPAIPNSGAPVRAALATSYAPMVRPDHDEMRRLVADLRGAGGADAPVLVIGSTDGLSDDTIRVVDGVERGDRPPLRVLATPHVDTRDEYPLAALLAADLVVLPDPLPYALPPDREGVQRTMYDLLTGSTSFGSAFRSLPGTYAVDDGVTLRVLERIRPTTIDEALAALAEARRNTPVVPPDQVPLISVGGFDGPIVDPNGDRDAVLEAGRDGDGRWIENALIYVGARPGAAIGGTVEFFDRTCAGVDLAVATIDDASGTVTAGSARHLRLASGTESTFDLAPLVGAGGDLLISLDQEDPQRPCEARLDLTAEASDRAAAKSLLVEGDTGSTGSMP